MPTFYNLMDVMNYTKQQTLIALHNEVSIKVRQIVKDFTDQLVYTANFSPKDYKRTYEFLNSITVGEIKKIGKDKFEIEIFFDTSKINAYISEPGHWNQHADIYGNDVSQFIPLWIEYGTKGSLWDREPANITKEVKEYLEKTGEHIQELKKVLMSKGFYIK